MSKLRGILWRLAVVGVVLWWALSGGPLPAVGEWALFGYLCWRAAPGVRSDLAHFRGWNRALASAGFSSRNKTEGRL